MRNFLTRFLLNCIEIVLKRFWEIMDKLSRPAVRSWASGLLSSNLENASLSKKMKNIQNPKKLTLVSFSFPCDRSSCWRFDMQSALQIVKKTKTWKIQYIETAIVTITTKKKDVLLSFKLDCLEWDLEVSSKSSRLKRFWENVPEKK